MPFGRVLWPTGRSDLGAEVLVVKSGGSVQAAVDGASAQYLADGVPRAILIAPGYYDEDVLVRCDEIHLIAIGGPGTVYLKSLTFSDATLESLEAFNSSADPTTLVVDPENPAPPWNNGVNGIYCTRSYNSPVWVGDAIASLRVIGAVDGRIAGGLLLEDVLAYKALERRPPWPPWPPRPPRPRPPRPLPTPMVAPIAPSPELIAEMLIRDPTLDPLVLPPWPPLPPVYRHAAFLLRAAGPEFIHSTFFKHLVAWNCVDVLLRDCQIEEDGDLAVLYDAALGLPSDTSNNGVNAVDSRFNAVRTQGVDGRLGGRFFERCTVRDLSLGASGTPASEMRACSVTNGIDFATVGPTLTFYAGDYYNAPTGAGATGWTRVPSL